MPPSVKNRKRLESVVQYLYLVHFCSSVKSSMSGVQPTGSGQGRVLCSGGFINAHGQVI